ncbi:MAG: hypothetical protein JW929_00585 [Anaerolineales bacterium]|nr:hypothetical protein [Anaerolineales bacterium]
MRAMKYFLQALETFPDSIEAKCGFLYCHVRTGNIREAERIIPAYQDLKIEDLDDLSAFRLFYSRIRVMQENKQIDAGKSVIEENSRRFSNEFQGPIKMEKALFLFLEKHSDEALSALMKCWKEISDDIREDFLGRHIFLLLQMNKKNEAIQCLWGNMINHFTINKLLLLFMLLAIARPIYFILLYCAWIIFWALLPVTNWNTILIGICTVITGTISVYSVILKKPALGFALTCFLLSTLGIYFMKDYTLCSMAAVVFILLLTPILLKLSKRTP